MGYARSLIRDRDRADEIVQEAFARLAARWPGPRDPRAYLNTIIANLARTEWRRRGRPDPVLPIAEEFVDDAETRLDVRDAVWSLPHAQRNVIWLRYYAGLPISEIAQVLRRPEGSVKALHYDGKRRLAHLLGRT